MAFSMSSITNDAAPCKADHTFERGRLNVSAVAGSKYFTEISRVIGEVFDVFIKRKF